MKIVDKLCNDNIEKIFNSYSGVRIFTIKDIMGASFKAGHQAAIDQLNAIEKDKFFSHIGTNKDFIEYLDREVEE